MEHQETPKPRADLEIIEWCCFPVENRMDLVLPFDARLNGQELAVSAEHPIKIHDVSLTGERPVFVTLTFAVTSLSVVAKSPEESRAEVARRRNEEYRKKLASRGLIPAEAVA